MRTMAKLQPQWRGSAFRHLQDQCIAKRLVKKCSWRIFGNRIMRIGYFTACPRVSILSQRPQEFSFRSTDGFAADYT